LVEKGLRVGVVGLGKMGLIHASVLSVLPGVEVAVLCEKSGLTRRFFKKVFEVPIVKDVRDFAGLGLDAVYVTTPISSHFPIAKTVYEERIARNLFVEKTLASNYDESKGLCELASAVGGVNMVGYLRRFAVTFMKAKKLLSEGAVGDVVSFEAHAYSSDYYGVGEGLGSSGARGGVLKDLGCHVLDLAFLLFGDFQVNTQELQQPSGGSSEDSLRFRVHNTSRGFEGEFDVSWCVEGYRFPEVGLTVKGSKGVIEVNDDRVALKLDDEKAVSWYRHDLKDNVGFWLGWPEYYRENECFVKSVRENKIVEPNFGSSAKVDLVIEQVLQGFGDSGR